MTSCCVSRWSFCITKTLRSCARTATATATCIKPSTEALVGAGYNRGAQQNYQREVIVAVAMLSLSTSSHASIKSGLLGAFGAQGETGVGVDEDSQQKRASNGSMRGVRAHKRHTVGFACLDHDACIKKHLRGECLDYQDCMYNKVNTSNVAHVIHARGLGGYTAFMDVHNICHTCDRRRIFRQYVNCRRACAVHRAQAEFLPCCKGCRRHVHTVIVHIPLNPVDDWLTLPFPIIRNPVTLRRGIHT
jgi:hypothetical protein